MQWTFYGIDGRRLVTARWDWVAPPYTVLTEMSRNIYFAGKLIRTGGDSVVLDRLSSVRYRKNGGTTERLDYFPYGEEKPGARAQAREKFATYFRDARDKLIVGAAIRPAEAGGRWPSLAFVHTIGKERLGPHFPVEGLSAFAVSADATLLAVGSSVNRRALLEKKARRLRLYNLRDSSVAGKALHPWHREKRDNPWVNQLVGSRFPQTASGCSPVRGDSRH